jgi:hypothetical protein
LIGALFFPSGSYFSDAAQGAEIFGVQTLPAMLFAVVLALCFRWVLEMERYPTGLLALGAVVSYIIMYPVAVAAWPIIPAVIGATGFGIILTALVVLLDTRFGTIRFWTLSVLTSALAALPFEFDIFGSLFSTDNVSATFKSYCQGLSLFLPWEIAWIAALLTSAPVYKQDKASEFG